MTGPSDCLEICILAGGLSSRMGRNKAALRLGRRTLQGHVRAHAAELGLPVRMVRKDLVARCGPLGGIYSALKTTRAPAILFLACDMPFVTASVLRTLLEKFDGQCPVFARAERGPGFPAILPKSVLPIVEQLMARQNLSVRSLALATQARLVALPRGALLNINTPQDLVLAKKRLLRHRTSLSKTGDGLSS